MVHGIYLKGGYIVAEIFALEKLSRNVMQNRPVDKELKSPKSATKIIYLLE